eukprot:1137040-Pelagomonas_calceolata.AAC.1
MSVIKATCATALFFVVPWGHVLPGIHQTRTSSPLVRETHASLSQCVSFSLIDVGSVITACVAFYFSLPAQTTTCLERSNDGHCVTGSHCKFTQIVYRKCTAAPKRFSMWLEPPRPGNEHNMPDGGEGRQSETKRIHASILRHDPGSGWQLSVTKRVSSRCKQSSHHRDAQSLPKGKSPIVFP